MTNKINYDSMKKLFDEQLRTFVQKNSDYGNSFERSLESHGLLASIVRMEDKMNRLSTLAQGDKDAQISSESLSDTLMDLSNYAAMTAAWLMHKDDDCMYDSDRIFSISTDIYTKDFQMLSDVINGSVEEEEKPLKISLFKRHDEKVNEREHFNGVLSDHTIIKNWDLVGDGETIRSRTTGQYFTEDDNPELFRKIYGVLMAYHGYTNFKKMKDQLTGTDEEFEGRFNDLKETVFEQINRSREVVTTELKGLENGYVIRQHKNSHNSYRYTLAFNPEGTLKVEGEVAKPYVIECFSNDPVGTNTWAIHVFDTREDMVAALNYDLRVRRTFESKNFGYSIKELDVNVVVFTHSDVPKVLNIWDDTFGEEFNNQMLSKDLNTETSINFHQGIKTFGPVFISKKTGALIIKGTIREDSVKRPCGFIWFGDTKEVLLEVDHTLPKFNYNGIIHGVTYDNDKYVRYFNQLYDSMSEKIMSKFYSWSVSEAESDLKNLVFFNEDDEEAGSFLMKTMSKQVVCHRKNDKLQIDFTDSEAYLGENLENTDGQVDIKSWPL